MAAVVDTDVLSYLFKADSRARWYRPPLARQRVWFGVACVRGFTSLIWRARAGHSARKMYGQPWKSYQKDVAAEISLLLTPKEAKSSFASFEFDDPIPSKL